MDPDSLDSNERPSPAEHKGLRSSPGETDASEPVAHRRDAVA